MRTDEVIIKPHVTEKTTMLREKENKYTFIVNKRANKITVENSIRKMVEVVPTQVNIINVKVKRMN